MSDVRPRRVKLRGPRPSWAQTQQAGGSQSRNPGPTQGTRAPHKLRTLSNLPINNNKNNNPLLPPPLQPISQQTPPHLPLQQPHNLPPSTPPNSRNLNLNQHPLLHQPRLHHRRRRPRLPKRLTQQRKHGLREVPAVREDVAHADDVGKVRVRGAEGGADGEQGLGGLREDRRGEEVGFWVVSEGGVRRGVWGGGGEGDTRCSRRRR